MILLRMLDHDMHVSKRDSIPLWIETPAKPEFLPVLVSSSTGSFLTSRRLTSENRIRSGVFKYDSDKLDTLVPIVVSSALELSKLEKWPNICKNVESAFEYIRRESGLDTLPHMCLIPDGFDDKKVTKIFGRGKITDLSGDDSNIKIPVYHKICRVFYCGVSNITFLSRPDFVGLYTQFQNGSCSVLLHNVRRGMSFMASV